MPSETPRPIQHILCPTDFPPASGAALDYAERLAVCSGARLLVLHVQPGWYGAGDIDYDTTDELTRLQSRAPEVEVDHLVLGGSPGEVISWVAQEHECDQIVMGTHGRTGLVSLLMGSVAEYVVRNARCPVLTVRFRPEHEEPLKKPKASTVMPMIQSL